MRLCMVVVLVLAQSVGTSQENKRLDGCPEPNAIAGALERIRETGWQKVSLPRLRSIWPTELDGLDCDAKVCRSAWSKDRIIKGHCQCCSTFLFEQERNADGSKSEKLQNIIINYTSHRREDLVAVAKGFGRASGFKEADINIIGNDATQDFTWEGQKEFYGVEIRFTARDSLWELYFNISRTTKPAERTL